jgi:hypothetical protein
MACLPILSLSLFDSQLAVLLRRQSPVLPSKNIHPHSSRSRRCSEVSKHAPCIDAPGRRLTRTTDRRPFTLRRNDSAVEGRRCILEGGSTEAVVVGGGFALCGFALPRRGVVEPSAPDGQGGEDAEDRRRSRGSGSLGGGLYEDWEFGLSRSTSPFLPSFLSLVLPFSTLLTCSPSIVP